jgi:hypothetical protein
MQENTVYPERVSSFFTTLPMLEIRAFTQSLRDSPRGGDLPRVVPVFLAKYRANPGLNDEAPTGLENV